MKRSFVERFAANQCGAVAPVVGVSLFALVAVGGIAFDYARMAGMDTELQNAADQAALAAASQLDGFDASNSTGGLGACARARQAALNLLTTNGTSNNQTYFANDGGTPPVTITDADDPGNAQCNASGGIQFYQDKAATVPATTDAQAKFVQVTVDARRARFALTPVVSALSSGNISASARAGMGSALCKVPPLMICDPNPSGTTDWDALKGDGLRAAAISGSSWTPGGFGYLGANDTVSTQEALAFVNPVFSCQSVDTSSVNTGNPTPAVAALNTRFDIEDYGSGSNPLSQCTGSVCAPALNTTKDFVRNPTASGTNACKIHNSGWHIPTNKFIPKAYSASDGPTTTYDADGLIDAMGLPRDNCHYGTYNHSCPGGKLGDGSWARADYFNKYHSSQNPSADDASLNESTMTRYETYKWEMQYNHIPDQYVSGSSGDKQAGIPVCRPNPPDLSPRDRRVLQVAIGSNCSSLNGASANVNISNWVDFFFVEPGAPNNARGNSLDTGNEVYLEVIGRSSSGANSQIVRRDMPYLVR